MSQGTSPGDFALARSVKPGIYHFRANTNWMRNAGPAYFYNHAIRMGGFRSTSPTSKRGTASKPDVQFFHEEGELVSGLRPRVAVKAINSNGLGENIIGSMDVRALLTLSMSI